MRFKKLSRSKTLPENVGTGWFLPYVKFTYTASVTPIMWQTKSYCVIWITFSTDDMIPKICSLLELDMFVSENYPLSYELEHFHFFRMK